jgi:hypothetical protein
MSACVTHYIIEIDCDWSRAVEPGWRRALRHRRRGLRSTILAGDSNRETTGSKAKMQQSRGLFASRKQRHSLRRN